MNHLIARHLLSNDNLSAGESVGIALGLILLVTLNLILIAECAKGKESSCCKCISRFFKEKGSEEENRLINEPPAQMSV